LRGQTDTERERDIERERERRRRIQDRGHRKRQTISCLLAKKIYVPKTSRWTNKEKAGTVAREMVKHFTLSV